MTSPRNPDQDQERGNHQNKENIFTYNLQVDSSSKSYLDVILDDIKKALIAGGVCAFVSAGLNPMDVTKIRMQNQSAGAVKYAGFISGARLIFKEEGWYGLTKGMEASMLREISYSSIRIGAYEPLRGSFASLLGHDPKDTTPVVKFASALMSGAVGAALANPLDLIKTRFQAAMPGEPLPYPSTFAAIRSIYLTNGIFNGLYKGWQVTTTRAAILTSAQIGSYDSIKNNLLVKKLGFQEGFLLHLTSSMMAGIITTTATNPGLLSLVVVGFD
jgi:hypothetical protein